jgi:uncharacterized RDD family membrane protein YckC
MNTENSIDAEEVVIKIDSRRVERSLRFVHFLVDTFIFKLLIGVVVKILVKMESPLVEYMNREGLGVMILLYLVEILLFVIFIGGLEAITSGKTIGKMLTGCRAINIDGTALTAATAFKRALVRIVPFEVLSAFDSNCRPWHDEWTDTAVVKV